MINDRTLYRIKALRDFSNVKSGDLGGFIEKEDNLSHNGNAWVFGNAEVSGNAWVFGNARVYSNAKVSGNAWVSGDAEVSGDAMVSGDACVFDNARVYSNADYSVIQGFGSQFRTTTFFKCKDNSIKVNCGCFHGTLEEFADKVKETHKDTKYAREYLAIIEAIKIHFEIE